MVFQDVSLNVSLIAEEDADYYVIRTFEIEDIKVRFSKEYYL